MKWNLETLIQQKEIVDKERFNDPYIYENTKIWGFCTGYSELLENMIKLQEGK